MAELTTLARPYARAAFDQAKAQKTLDSWSTCLDMLAAVADVAKVGDLFSSPSLTSEQKSETLLGLCGEGLDESQKNFVRLLAENKRLSLLSGIAELFELYKAEHEKSVDVEVHSAYEISDELSNKLAASLKKTLDRNVSLNTVIDKSLIGGVVIHAGDMVIDNSVRGRLEKLSDALQA